VSQRIISPQTLSRIEKDIMSPQQQPLDSTNSLADNAKAATHRPMEYRFISGLANSYSKPVRAHVLKRHLRERRLRAVQKERSKGKPEDDEDDKDDLALVRPRAERSRRSNAVKFPAAPERGHAPKSRTVTSNATSLVRYVGPKSLLGQGTVDPFLSGACRTTSTENLLIDYCQ
jgi:hypothetical protein